MKAVRVLTLLLAMFWLAVGTTVARAGEGREPLHTVTHPHNRGAMAAFSPGGALLLASYDWDGSFVALYEPETAEETAGTVGVGRVLWDVAFSSDGSRLLLVEGWGPGSVEVHLLDAETLERLETLQRRAMFTAAYLDGGERILTTDQRLRLWNADSLEEESALELDIPDAQVGEIVVVRVCPREKHAYTASERGYNILWDLEEGAKVASLPHRGPVWDAQFTDDGRRLVSVSHDRTAVIWDAATGEQRRLLRHDGPVLSLALDGRRGGVITGDNDGEVRRWDADSGEPLQSFDLGRRVLTLRLSPDGELLLAGGAEGRGVLLRTETLRPVAELQPHRDEMTAAGFSRDGRFLVTGESGVFHIYDIADMLSK